MTAVMLASALATELSTEDSCLAQKSVYKQKLLNNVPNTFKT